MSSLDELDTAVATIRRGGNALAVLQCTSAYPCPPEKTGLNLIPAFGERYGCTVGLSDHSGTIYPGLAAATLGAGVLELHVTLSREMFGPDVIASVTTSELRQLIDGVRHIERMMTSPVSKDASAAETAPLRRLFTKNIVARTELNAGTLLRAEDLALKKAGAGLAPSRLAELVGARLRRNVRTDEPLFESDVE
jgi:N-acetylneuraminate synthase